MNQSTHQNYGLPHWKPKVEYSLQPDNLAALQQPGSVLANNEPSTRPPEEVAPVSFTQAEYRTRSTVPLDANLLKSQVQRMFDSNAATRNSIYPLLEHVGKKGTKQSVEQQPTRPQTIHGHGHGADSKMEGKDEIKEIIAKLQNMRKLEAAAWSEFGPRPGGATFQSSDYNAPGGDFTATNSGGFADNQHNPSSADAEYYCQDTDMESSNWGVDHLDPETYIDIGQWDGNPQSGISSAYSTVDGGGSWPSTNHDLFDPSTHAGAIGSQGGPNYQPASSLGPFNAAAQWPNAPLGTGPTAFAPYSMDPQWMSSQEYGHQSGNVPSVSNLQAPTPNQLAGRGVSKTTTKAKEKPRFVNIQPKPIWGYVGPFWHLRGTACKSVVSARLQVSAQSSWLVIVPSSAPIRVLDVHWWNESLQFSLLTWGVSSGTSIRGFWL